MVAKKNPAFFDGQQGDIQELLKDSFETDSLNESAESPGGRLKRGDSKMGELIQREKTEEVTDLDFVILGLK